MTRKLMTRKFTYEELSQILTYWMPLPDDPDKIVAELE